MEEGGTGVSKVCGDVNHYQGSYVLHPLLDGREVRSGTGDMTAGDSICIRPMDHPDWHTSGRLWWKRTPDLWQSQDFPSVLRG